MELTLTPVGKLGDGLVSNPDAQYTCFHVEHFDQGKPSILGFNLGKLNEYWLIVGHRGTFNTKGEALAVLQKEMDARLT
jgi:hypothetical protein